MLITRKYTYGDGRVEYVEEDIDIEDDELSAEEALDIITGGYAE